MLHAIQSKQRRSWPLLATAIVIAALAGCDEFEVPITAEPTRNIEPGWLTLRTVNSDGSMSRGVIPSQLPDSAAAAASIRKHRENPRLFAGEVKFVKQRDLR